MSSFIITEDQTWPFIKKKNVLHRYIEVIVKQNLQELEYVTIIGQKIK